MLGRRRGLMRGGKKGLKNPPPSFSPGKKMVGQSCAMNETVFSPGSTCRLEQCASVGMEEKVMADPAWILKNHPMAV